MPKFIFVTGGVVSSLGKGIAAASIGLLLEAMARLPQDVRLLVIGGNAYLDETRRRAAALGLGDRVAVELSPYDLSRGRITYRYK